MTFGCEAMGEPLIDEDIRKARTLPSAWYTEMEHFKQLQSVFSGWQFAAHQSEFETNNVLPLEHIEAINGESMVLVKDEQTACYSNVCTHRGMRVALEACTAKKLQCRYHGRTFNLDGTLRHMPEFKEAIDFPSASDNLAEFPLKQWMGMHFTALNAAAKIPWEGLEHRLGFLGLEAFVLDAARNRDHTIDANWMLYVDNYLEGFHIPYVHPELNQALDYGAYTTETFDGGVLQIGKAMEGDVKFELPEGHPDAGQDIAAYYLWLFPNMMFNFYPWGLSLNIVVPVSPTKTRVLYRGYVANAELASQGAGALLDTVEDQDQWVIELVQRGMASSAYDRGRYSPTREQGVHHFHRMLSALFDE